METGAFN